MIQKIKNDITDFPFHPNTQYLDVPEVLILQTLGIVYRERREIYSMQTFSTYHEIHYVLNYEDSLNFAIYFTSEGYFMRIYDKSNNMEQIFEEFHADSLERLFHSVYDYAFGKNWNLSDKSTSALQKFMNDSEKACDNLQNQSLL